MAKIVLLCKRALSEVEKDELEKHLSCVYFNERVHMNKKINELLAASELLVLDIYKEVARSYYEGNQKLLCDGSYMIVLLEKCGEKVDRSKVYGESLVKKYLPVPSENKEQFLLRLTSPHIPKVKPAWRKYLGYVFVCIKSST